MARSNKKQDLRDVINQRRRQSYQSHKDYMAVGQDCQALNKPTEPYIMQEKYKEKELARIGSPKRNLTHEGSKSPNRNLPRNSSSLPLKATDEGRTEVVVQELSKARPAAARHSGRDKISPKRKAYRSPSPVKKRINNTSKFLPGTELTWGQYTRPVVGSPKPKSQDTQANCETGEDLFTTRRPQQRSEHPVKVLVQIPIQLIDLLPEYPNRGPPLRGRPSTEEDDESRLCTIFRQVAVPEAVTPIRSEEDSLGWEDWLEIYPSSDELEEEERGNH